MPLRAHEIDELNTFIGQYDFLNCPDRIANDKNTYNSMRSRLLRPDHALYVLQHGLYNITTIPGFGRASEQKQRDAQEYIIGTLEYRMLKTESEQLRLLAEAPPAEVLGGTLRIDAAGRRHLSI